MAYTVDYDEKDGIVVCRLIGFLEEMDARHFADAMFAGIKLARSKHGPLRVLIDNREGRVTSPTAAADLGERLRTEKRPGDRTAIIVSDSLSKMQAKRVTTTDHEIFISENAART